MLNIPVQHLMCIYNAVLWEIDCTLVHALQCHEYIITLGKEDLKRKVAYHGTDQHWEKKEGEAYRIHEILFPVYEMMQSKKVGFDLKICCFLKPNYPLHYIWCHRKEVGVTSLLLMTCSSIDNS